MYDGQSDKEAEDSADILEIDVKLWREGMVIAILFVYIYSHVFRHYLHSRYESHKG